MVKKKYDPMISKVNRPKYQQCQLFYLWLEKKDWVKPRNTFEVLKQFIEETRSK